ncbi:MAG: hypothetical protein GY708_23680 [Actinomycetia bacterium]|nr:hypothetical protein [Actinomycetes bacterium]
MPWCDHCDVYLAPNTITAEGACPTCEHEVDTADLKAAAKPPTRAPWHFWVMVVALVGYLGWRLVDGIIWLVGQI